MPTVKFERTALPGVWYRRVYVAEDGTETRQPGDLFRPAHPGEPKREYFAGMIAKQNGSLVDTVLDGQEVTMVAMTSREEDTLLSALGLVKARP